MFKELSSAIVIVLVLVFGGLAYLLLPGRLNGPTPNLANVNTAVNSEFQNASTSTRSSVQR